jgi:hypothetical protein
MANFPGLFKLACVSSYYLQTKAHLGRRKFKSVALSGEKNGHDGGAGFPYEI